MNARPSTAMNIAPLRCIVISWPPTVYSTSFSPSSSCADPIHARKGTDVSRAAEPVSSPSLQAAQQTPRAAAEG